MLKNFRVGFSISWLQTPPEQGDLVGNRCGFLQRASQWWMQRYCPRGCSFSFGTKWSYCVYVFLPEHPEGVWLLGNYFFLVLHGNPLIRYDDHKGILKNCWERGVGRKWHCVTSFVTVCDRLIIAELVTQVLLIVPHSTSECISAGWHWR